MRFLADCMLGKLARWLRILGYDTAYDNVAEDDALLERALSERRVLLTRDRPLYRRAEGIKCVHVDAIDLDSQIAQLVRDVDVSLDRPTFTRCLECNTVIEQITPESVREIVPPHVMASQTEFFRCTACNRVYWPGSHTGRMLERLNRIRARV